MTSIRIHVAREHNCGQVHEEILHVESADFSLNTDFPPLFPPLKEPLEPFTLPEPPVTKLNFTGICNKIEVNGMEWVSRRGLFCIKCGADMLFGNRPKKENSL